VIDIPKSGVGADLGVASGEMRVLNVLGSGTGEVWLDFDKGTDTDLSIPG